MSATPEQIKAAVVSPNFSHTRQGNGCWRDVVWVYHRDQTSPSGYKLAVGGDAAVVDPIVRQYRCTSPLSPTER